MRRGGSITFGDIVGKLDVLRIECGMCGRLRKYYVGCSVERYGVDGKMNDEF
ncbi:MAG TPA: hypothetical protein VEJ37_05020 [Xanthobacteraceae bacterium]|nr:hypothetical protein [Xanthobacteraceae bacterium]